MVSDTRNLLECGSVQMKCASVSRTLLSPLSLLRHIASSSWDSGRAKIHACGGDKKRSQFLQNDTDAGREVNPSQQKNYGTIRFTHIVSEYPPLYRHCGRSFSSHFNTAGHKMLTYSLDMQHTNWPSWARWEFLISALALDNSSTTDRPSPQSAQRTRVIAGPGTNSMFRTEGYVVFWRVTEDRWVFLHPRRHYSSQYLPT